MRPKQSIVVACLTIAFLSGGARATAIETNRAPVPATHAVVSTQTAELDVGPRRGTSEEMRRYAKREQASPTAAKFQGGDGVIIIGSSALVIVLLIVIIIILL